MFARILLLVVAALVALSDAARVIMPNTDCSALPGRWRGFSQFNPLAERYNFTWGVTAGSFNVTNLYPSPSEWTYAYGELINGNTTATMYFPEKKVWLQGPVAYNVSET